MVPYLFLGFAGLLIATALMVVLHKNPVTSALFLVLSFTSLAGIYLLLQAEFIGMVQIIVYAGAIMVLFLFVIMYLNLQHDVEKGAQIAVRRGIGWMVGALMLLFAGLIVRNGGFSPGPVQAVPPSLEGGNAQAIGRVLYSRFLFPFEITSILLLVAMVGAIVMIKGRPAADGAEGEKE
ncbi:MAG: NADH-quinone oxidoreductase subunit J [Candidatus Eisenbacteria bacterium]|nr:NADH-quinone oxidoreductase subunit J [Candidatus Eisenbacteria bacterium]